MKPCPVCQAQRAAGDRYCRHCGRAVGGEVPAPEYLGGNFYRTVVEAATEGIWCIDADNRTTFVNERMASMIGYPAEEMLGRSVFDFLGPEAAEQETANLERRRAGVREQYEFSLVRRDGSPLWVSVSAAPWLGSDGDYRGALAMVTDVSRRRAAREAVQRREAILEAVGASARRLLRCGDWREEMSAVLQRLGLATGVSRAYLFENHPDAEGTLRTSQRYEWAGPGIEPQIDSPYLQNLRYDESGFGRWRDLLADEQDLSGVVADFPEDEQELLRAQGIQSLAVVPIFVGARWFGWMGFDDCARDRSWTRAEIEALRAAADAVAAAIERAATTDALREREEQLMLAQKMEAVGRLAGGVAHDFNNLLTAITGYAELMHSSLDTQESLRADCEEILDAADRAAALTRQLLAFGRRQTIEPRRVDVGHAIDRVRGMLERIIGENVKLFTAVSPDQPAVTIDPGQLEQILVNLVVNARDAMPGGGRIEINTRVVDLDARTAWRLGPGRFVEIGVKDTGEGIPDDIRERIFEPFFTTKTGKGTGLGLATVYGIVEQAGGEIRVESAAGEGTTFRILLPWRAEGSETVEAVRRGAPIEAQGVLSGKKILLVEDREQVRRLIVTVLSQHGCEVIEADTIRKAESRFRNQAIALLVADIVLPDGNGRDLAERLRASQPDLPVVLISGYDEQRAGGKVEDWPVRFDYLAKPFSPATLVQQVVRSLEAAG